jgi:hypothetical protein
MTTLDNFLTTGQLPPSMRDRSKLFGQLRDQILTLTQPTNMKMFSRNPATGEVETLDTNPQQPFQLDHVAQRAKFEKARDEIAALKDQPTNHAPTLTAATNAMLAARGKPPLEQVAPKPIHRAAVPAATAPAATGFTNAAQFASQGLTMCRSEWDKLSASDKSRFFKEQGKLVDDPKPAAPLSKNGDLTRAGFDAMTPAAKSAHCQAHKPIID